MINGNMGPTALKDDAPQVVQVIYTETERRGSGQHIHDPVRRVKQVYSLDGVLLVEHDPYGNLTVREVMNVVKHMHTEEKPLEQLLLEYVRNKNYKPF
jgi:ABC-type multidrug transport system ATPase subunit